MSRPSTDYKIVVRLWEIKYIYSWHSTMYVYLTPLSHGLTTTNVNSTSIRI